MTLTRVVKADNIEEVQKLLDDRLMTIDIVYSGIIDLINFIGKVFNGLLVMLMLSGCSVFVIKSIVEGFAFRENILWYLMLVAIILLIKFVVFTAASRARAIFWNEFNGCKFNIAQYYFRSLKNFNNLEDWEQRKIWESQIYPLLNPATDDGTGSSTINNKEESNT